MIKIIMERMKKINKKKFININNNKKKRIINFDDTFNL